MNYEYKNKAYDCSADACFTDYRLLNGVPINITIKISSPFHCKYMCDTTPGCIAFNYHKWYLQCTMLSSVSSNGIDPFYMSGYLTDCSGTIGMYFMYAFIHNCNRSFIVVFLKHIYQIRLP